MKRLDTIRVYRDSLGEWRWTRRAPAGRTITESNTGQPTSDAAATDAERRNPDTNFRMEIART